MQENTYSTISIKAVLNNGEVQYIKSSKLSRIYHFIQGVKNSEVDKYYLRITYKTITDVFNKKILLINESEHKIDSELKRYVGHFTEK